MASLKRTAADIPIRNKGDNLCPLHQDEVTLSCTFCDGEVICKQCTTDKHNQHEFVDIADTASDKKYKLEQYVKLVEENELPSTENKLKRVDVQVNESSNHFKTLENNISLHGEKVKAEIDRITKEFIERCREIEKQNNDYLVLYKQELKSLCTFLKVTMDECKVALQSENSVLLIDTEKDIQKETKTLGNHIYKTAIFIAASVPSKQIQDGFGTLLVKETPEVFVPQEFKMSQDVAMSNVEPQYMSNKATTVVSEFTYSSPISSVEASSSDSLWISYRYDENLSLVNMQGDALKEKELKSCVFDISVSPVTGNLWFSCYDNTVYEVIGKTRTEHFTTDFEPQCLCVTPDDNIVIGDAKRLAVYNTTGEMLNTVDNSGEPMVFYPFHITVCTNSGDIAVCDSGVAYYLNDPKDRIHVSVFNSKLEMKYRYYGPDESQCQSLKFMFYPGNAVYDSQGHLLVTDCNNKCVHILSSEGQLLKTVAHTGNQVPGAMTLMQDGLLCVVVEDEIVKFISYTV